MSYGSEEEQMGIANEAGGEENENLTPEERSACSNAATAASHEVRTLLDIVERLTGERFEDYAATALHKGRSK